MGHEYKQHTEKTIQCGQCDQLFAKEYYRKVHINSSHTKENNKMCNYCGERFWDKTTFQAHVNRHTGFRPFECDVCQKTFLVKNHLTTHSKLHTLPFKCNVCEKGFIYSAHLKDHIRKVHEGIRTDCRFGCGWQAAHRRAVQRHEIQYCKLNPVPNAPYTVAMGTENKLILQKFHEGALF